MLNAMPISNSTKLTGTGTIKWIQSNEFYGMLKTGIGVYNAYYFLFLQYRTNVFESYMT